MAIRLVYLRVKQYQVGSHKDGLCIEGAAKDKRTKFTLLPQPSNRRKQTEAKSYTIKNIVRPLKHPQSKKAITIERSTSENQRKGVYSRYAVRLDEVPSRCDMPKFENS